MDRITLAHGSGGRLMHELINSIFISKLDNAVLRQKADSATLRFGRHRIAFTTDSYVVDPIFFPGGDIGSLAVYGTVNDLAVCGAKPLFISVGIVIEEGLEVPILKSIATSISFAARRSGVQVVTGDTKVVEKGSCDKVFLNTSGLGEVYYNGLSADNIKEGDSIIVSGPIGEHAISVLSEREGFNFSTNVKSDSAPLNTLIANAVKVSKNVRFMRDPTRGGVATTLNEIVEGKDFGIALEEDAVPVKTGVRQACELLGLDPLYLACEGRAIIIVAKKDGAKVLRALRASPGGGASEIIGSVTREHRGKVYLNTVAGGKRIVDMLAGEQLPRIC